MTKKLTAQIKKDEQKRIDHERTVLNLCVTKKDLGERVRGIQI